MSSERLNLAATLSRFAHEGQRGKAGAPYYLHPLHVSEHVTTEDEKVVALLHDVLEDTTIKPETISDLFGDRVLAAVTALTRKQNESYEDFIARAAKDPIARVVKIADIKHNIDLNRLTEIKMEDRHRVEKYRISLEFLLSQE